MQPGASAPGSVSHPDPRADEAQSLDVANFSVIKSPPLLERPEVRVAVASRAPVHRFGCIPDSAAYRIRAVRNAIYFDHFAIA